MQMTIRKFPTYTAVIVIISIVFFTNACSRKVFNVEMVAQDNYPISDGGLRVVYRSPGDVAADTDVVVIGHAIEKREVINVNHGFDELLIVGQVYGFQVDEYLKGSGEDIIYVVNREGRLERPGIGSSYTEEDILEAREKSPSPVLRMGKRYILFLDHLSRSEIEMENYYYAHSWRFNVTDPNNVIHNVPITDPYVHEMKYPHELEILIQHLRDPIAFPYPEPEYRPVHESFSPPVSVPTAPSSFRVYPEPGEVFTYPQEVQSYPFPEP
jgi:hypothetical protein